MDQYPPFDEDHLLYLLQGHIGHSLTTDEKKELNTFAESSDEYKHLLTEISNESLRDLLLIQQQAYDVDAALVRVKSKTGGETATHSLRQRLYGIAALAATLLFVTFLVFYYSNVRHLNTPVLNANLKIRLLPGTNKATLTLANGQKINLDDSHNGTIAQQSGFVVKKQSGGLIAYLPTNPSNNTDTVTAYNTVETPRGGQYRLQLPDGTKVWLNAASSLKYPSNFNSKQRVVTLTGEGYFEVVHNAKQPFIVKANKQNITDIGTSFNVNSYTDEPYSTTVLVEGSIQLATEKKKLLLKPGQQAIIQTGSIKVSEADIETATAWKNNQLAFHHANIQSVLRQIARWYNIEVEYQGAPPEIIITGGVSRHADLSAILKILKLSEVHFKQEGHKLIILSQDH